MRWDSIKQWSGLDLAPARLLVLYNPEGIPIKICKPDMHACSLEAGSLALIVVGRPQADVCVTRWAAIFPLQHAQLLPKPATLVVPQGKQ